VNPVPHERAQLLLGQHDVGLDFVDLLVDALDLLRLRLQHLPRGGTNLRRRPAAEAARRHLG